MFRPTDLFDLGQTEHADLFDGCDHAWDVLKRLRDYVARRVRPLLLNRCDGVAYIGPQVSIGEGTVVEDGAMIQGPAIIGRDCIIRHNAYIRSDVIVGDGCLVGNACELKLAFLFNGAQVPHFNYVGDSIIGRGVHLGAGAKISNVRLLGGTVQVSAGERRLDTGLPKFGALVGDGAEVGCNAVLNPGSILGPGSVVYPNVSWRGVLAAGCIAKNRSAVEVVARRSVSNSPLLGRANASPPRADAS
jgi:NDP-sugar pyrophosphorylase family protein